MGYNMAPKVSRDFIDVTVQFAQHVSRITLLPLDEVLFRFTPLYLSFGLGRDFDPLHPSWQTFVAGVTPHYQKLVDWTYTFYLQQPIDVSTDVTDSHAVFGCFYYSIWPKNRVRIHFRNGEASSYGSLSRIRSPQRLAELTDMFRYGSI
ncbi:MAG: hypothetical protein ETSY2_25075, partial [Candidatus Entotheonella gemina]